MLVAELGLNVTDAAVIIAVIAFGFSKLADYRGWTRSPALVRQENADLRERNATLTAEVERLDLADREKAERIAVLESKLAELAARDQAAVLEAIREHEVYAQGRRVEQKAEHADAMNVWQGIREDLRSLRNA